MTKTIALKELLLSIMTVRFIVIVLVCCVLMPISVAVLSGDYLAQSEDYRQRAGLEERRENGKDVEISIYRPVPPLSALFNGVSQRAINGMRMQSENWSRPLASSSRNPVQSIFPTVDLTFIIAIILSGLAILLAHDAIAGEKAEATLRMMMSNPLARANIVLGKWIGISVALIIPFLLGMIINLLVFFLITGHVFNAEQWLTVLLITGAACLYLAAFVIVGVAVSAFSRSQAQAIFAGLAVWGLLVIILPQLSVAAAGALKPVETPQQLELQSRQLLNEFNNSIRNTNIPIAAELQARHADNTQVRVARRSNEWPKERAYRSRQAALEQEFDNRMAAQEDLGMFFSMLSAAGSLEQVVTTLADTGPHAQRTFIAEARDYGVHYFDQLFSNPAAYPTDEQVAGLERFHYRAPAFERKLMIVLWPLAALILFTALIAVITVFRFNSYDVR